MQCHDIRRAHEVKARGLETRNEWWVGRARQLGKELTVEPAEVVDRLGLGHPERPAVEFVQPGEAPRAKESLQVDDEQTGKHSGPNGDPIDRHPHSGSRPPQEPTREQARSRQRSLGNENRGQRQRQPDHELEHEQDAGDGDPSM